VDALVSVGLLREGRAVRTGDVFDVGDPAREGRTDDVDVPDVHEDAQPNSIAFLAENGDVPVGRRDDARRRRGALGIAKEREGPGTGRERDEARRHANEKSKRGGEQRNDGVLPGPGANFMGEMT